MAEQRPRNRIVVEGDRAWIALTRAQRACIDAADVGRVAPLRWCAQRRHGAPGFYAVATLPATGRRQVALHRFLLDAPPGTIVRFRNGDALDCRRANLVADAKRGPDVAPNPIRVTGDRAYLALAGGLEAVIDAADLPLVTAYHWYASRDQAGGRHYVYSGSNTERRGRRGVVTLGRVLLEAPPGARVAYRNGDPLDCRRANLLLTRA